MNTRTIITNTAAGLFTLASFVWVNDPLSVLHFEHAQGHAIVAAQVNTNDCNDLYHGPAGMHFNPCARITASSIDDLRPASEPNACWIEADGEPMSGPTHLMPKGSTVVSCSTLPGWYTDDDGQG